MDGVGVGVGVCGGVPYTHMCMHMHVKHVVNMINMDAFMLVAICNFYTCIHVHGCMCVCVCVHVCGDTPMPSDTPHQPAPSQSHREPKTPKFNNSQSN